ncbi:MAG: glycosyltransferase family 9 protein [Chloroflexota bacterium]
MVLRSILFVELLGGIGDLVIALPAIQALKRSHPHAAVTVFTFSPGAELLRRDPHAQRVIAIQRDVQSARDDLAAFLAEENFDLIVSDTRYEGIATLLEESAPCVISDLWRRPPDDELVGERFLHILRDEGAISVKVNPPPRIYLDEGEIFDAREVLGDLGVGAAPVFLCPSSGMRIKRWPEERFAAVGLALRERGAELVVICGDEPNVAKRIAQQAGAVIWPRGSLRVLAAALSSASLFVGVDTGLARLAAALEVPVITLFGPSWAGRYGHPSPHVNLQGYPACELREIGNFTIQPCWYQGCCPLPRWETCLEHVSVETVVEAAVSVLGLAAPLTTEAGPQHESRTLSFVHQPPLE